MRYHLRALITLLSAVTLFELIGNSQPAVAGDLTLFGLTDNNSLVSFSPDNPADTNTLNLTGVNGKLIGIDVRPANGLLYGITDTNTLYTFDLSTGAASLVGSVAPPTSPAQAFSGGLQSGFDFNPAVDRLRLVGSNTQNFRVNIDADPTTPGTQPALVDGNNGSLTPIAGVQPDGNLAYVTGDPNFGKSPQVTAAAYTQSFAGPPSPTGVTPPTRTTQLFGIDSALDVLVLQDPPNAGGLKTIGTGLGVDFGSTGGFDIFSAGANTPDLAFAASGSTFYSIDLKAGTAKTLGTIGGGSNLVGLAATKVPEPATVAGLFGLGLLGLVGRLRRQLQASGSAAE